MSSECSESGKVIPELITTEHTLSKDLESDVRIPYIVKDKVLMSPGVWNNMFYPLDAIKLAFEETDWEDKEIRSLFLDHKDRDAMEWVGEVLNIKCSDDGRVTGDLVFVDKPTAMKIHYGAKFGISPKVHGLTTEDNTMQKFLFKNLSVVINPAVKTAYINNQEEEKKEEVEEMAFWSTAYENSLPDNAFAAISSGGTKDDEGKTVPRSLRHLPHHNSSVQSATEKDSVDIPHLRNALARLSQTKISPEEMSVAKSHLEFHAKQLGIGEVGKEEKMSESQENKNEVKEMAEDTSAMTAILNEILAEVKSKKEVPECMACKERKMQTEKKPIEELPKEEEKEKEKPKVEQTMSQDDSKIKELKLEMESKIQELQQKLDTMEQPVKSTVTTVEMSHVASKRYTDSNEAMMAYLNGIIK